MRSKTNGSEAGSDRSVCDISIAPVATSMGSPTHRVRSQLRAAGPSSTRSGRSEGGRSMNGVGLVNAPSTPALITPLPAPSAPP